MVLARFNELSFGELGRLGRSSAKAATHSLTDRSALGEARWNEMYERHNFDTDPYGSVEPYVISYCLESQDSRRIVGAFDLGRRIFYPLWWDPRHEVSGDDGRGERHAHCANDQCVHPPCPPGCPM